MVNLVCHRFARRHWFTCAPSWYYFNHVAWLRQVHLLRMGRTRCFHPRIRQPRRSRLASNRLEFLEFFRCEPSGCQSGLANNQSFVLDGKLAKTVRANRARRARCGRGRALALPASQEQAAASARLPSPCRIDWHSAPVRPFVYLCAINFLLPDRHQSFGSRTSEFSYCGWVGQGLLVRGNWPRGQDAHGEAACETWARWRNFKWLKKSGTQRL